MERTLTAESHESHERSDVTLLITIMGDGRYMVGRHMVTTHSDGSLRCDCPAGRFHVPCRHRAKTLTYITGVTRDSVEMPEPLDVEQAAVEDLERHILKLTRASNTLTMELLDRQYAHGDALKKYKRLQLQLRMAVKFGDENERARIQEEFSGAEDAKIDSEIELDIAKAKLKDVTSARTATQSILRSVRPSP